MKLVLSEPRLLKESVGIISELVNEVTFKLDKEKIEITAMDPANVAMIMFKLLSSAFVEYNVKDEQEFSVNLDNLNQVLKRTKPTDTVTLETTDNKLKITLKGESTRTFSLSLIDVDESEQKIPELKFDVKVDMPSVKLTEAIDDMDIVAESVALIAETNKLTVQSEGRFNAAKVELLTNDATTIKMKEKQVLSNSASITVNEPEAHNIPLHSFKLEPDEVTVKNKKSHPEAPQQDRKGHYGTLSLPVNYPKSKRVAVVLLSLSIAALILSFFFFCNMAGSSDPLTCLQELISF